MLNPGDMVTPTVRLVRKIGEGGMGSVWGADHLALRTEVAVKFMSESLTADPGAMDRFRREATAAARVKSPHIVQVFDHGISPAGAPFIVMELLEGRDLREHLIDKVSLELPEIVHILTQACKGLSKAHAVGVVHRDIKPDNLFLLDPDGERFVKILDFGVAKQQQSNDDVMRMTATGTLVGTPYYMSPEQSLGIKDLDRLSDLWSLAVVTYQAVTGSLPFGGDTLGALFVAIDRGAFAPASVLVPGLPEAVDNWFSRALSRDPTQRYQTALELSQSFEAAAQGKDSLPGIAATTPPPKPSQPSLSDVAAVAATSGLRGAVTLEPQSGPSAEVLPRRTSLSTSVKAGIAGLVFAAGVTTFMISRRDPPSAVAPPAPASTAPAPIASDAPHAVSVQPPVQPPVQAPPEAPPAVVLTPAASDSAPGGPAGGAGGAGARVPGPLKKGDPKGSSTGTTPKPKGTVDRGF